jgi:hypothetical protein
MQAGPIIMQASQFDRELKRSYAVALTWLEVCSLFESLTGRKRSFGPQIRAQPISAPRYSLTPLSVCGHGICWFSVINDKSWFFLSGKKKGPSMQKLACPFKLVYYSHYSHEIQSKAQYGWVCNSHNARLVTKQTLTKESSPTSLTTLIATNLTLSHLKWSRFPNRWAECSKLTLLPQLSSSASASIVMLAICFLSQYNFSHFHHMTKRFHKKLTRRIQPWNHDNCSRNITGNKLSFKVVPTTTKTISNFCYVTLWVYCNIHFQEVIGATSKYYELIGSHVYHNLYFESVQGTLLIKASYNKGNVVLSNELTSNVETY